MIHSILPNWSLWPCRLIFIVTIVWVSRQMLTDNPTPMAVLFWDKLLHLGAWGLVVGLAYSAYQRPSGWYYCALAVFIYSVVLEALQPHLATREFSWWDILANGIGCLIAALASPALDSWLSKKVA